ncbi:MAG: thioester reductase domain-containing protein [Pseudomonadales bacterium]|nr:thioester reductase domain-containing protein [Pseudomonadales bacterium]
MTSANPMAWLRQDVIAEPLVNQWYAWTFLISPATAARYLTQSQMKVLKSFIESPEVHKKALQDPKMMGGPFIQQALDSVDEIKNLLDKSSNRDLALLVLLSEAIEELHGLLDSHPAGAALNELYPQIPEPLKGYVELVYDSNNSPSIRFIEPLLYRSEFYQPQHQTIALRLLPDTDDRAFVLSTPRLSADIELNIQRPFAEPLLDELFKARFTAVNVNELAVKLELNDTEQQLFSRLFTEEPPRHSANARYQGDGVRVRYMGHACVLIETASTSILVDPLISYEHPTGLARYSYLDLPETIDYAVITHNHQDHVMLETLLQIRHKIGKILIPAGNRGSLIDPNLKLCLKQIGFDNVVEVDHLENIYFPEGFITPLPFLGEHGDLDIATKAAWRVEAHGRSIMCVADSDNLDNTLYEHLSLLYGTVDILFLGMECEGAPYTWAYGPLLSKPASRKQADSRRLNGSDSVRGLQLIEQLQPSAIYVYAMGMEPWLKYITSIHYEEDSLAIIESNILKAACEQQGRTAKRVLGREEILLDPITDSQVSVKQSQNSAILPARRASINMPTLNEPSTNNESSMNVATKNKVEAIELTSTEKETDTLSNLLDELLSHSIKLSVSQGKLKVNGPKGSLTPELTSQIKDHKPELIAIIGEVGNSNSLTVSNVESNVETRTSVVGSTSNSNLSINEKHREALQDTMLADELSPIPPSPPQQNPLLNDNSTLLLTGATGFVGAFLLRELLEQTSAKVICLVRGSDLNAESKQRIISALKDYHIWQEQYADRIQPLRGDLAKPQLGLTETQWNELANNVDAIYHNGAMVHHLMPYQKLRDTNVLGTLEALRLTCEGKAKEFHFLSSLSVLPPVELAQGVRFEENTYLTKETVPAGGYNRSKWVAEHLVSVAKTKGLAATIYRPGPISGDSQQGAFNNNDFLYRLMQGYVYSGMAPDGEMPLDILPVDYLAQAIIYLSQQPKAKGGVYHLLHPDAVSSNVLFDAINNAGYPVERVPYQRWFAELTQIAQNNPEHPLFPLVALFASRNSLEQSADSGTGHKEAAPLEKEIPYCTNISQSLLAAAHFSLPAITEQLFATYIQAMEQKSVLAPQTSTPLVIGEPA